MDLILTKWIRTAMKLLTDIQWCCWDQCPACLREKVKGHHPDCELGWLIGATKEKPMTDQEECKHEKVYSNSILTSDPPQTPWICKLCGKTGTDRSSISFQEETYEQLLERFHGTRNQG